MPWSRDDSGLFIFCIFMPNPQARSMESVIRLLLLLIPYLVAGRPTAPQVHIPLSLQIFG